MANMIYVLRRFTSFYALCIKLLISAHGRIMAPSQCVIVPLLWVRKCNCSRPDEL